MNTPLPPHDPSDQATTPAAGGTATRRRRRWPWVAGVLLGLPLLLLVAALLGGRWLLTTEDGARTALGWVPGLQVANPRGSLLGDFAADRITYALPGDGAVIVDAPTWTGLRLARLTGDGPLPAPLPRLRLVIDRLAADRVTLRAGIPQPASPSAPLTSLELPVGLELGRLEVGEIVLGEAAAARLKAVSLGLTLADGRGTHVLRDLRLDWDRFRLDGEAQLGAAAPMPLDARLSLREQVAAPAGAGPSTRPATAATPSILPATPEGLAGWDAVLQARGPLQAFDATLRVTAAQQTLDAQAQVTPFAALPLSTLRARTENLDLAALASGLPRTALTARVEAALAAAAPTSGSTAAGTDWLASAWHLDVDLRNARAGRWDAGELPLRQLGISARHEPSATGDATIELGRLDARLGAAEVDAGRVHGSARWDGQRWSLDATLERLAPAELDARAPALRISGPLKLDGTPSLPFGDQAAPDAELTMKAQLDGQWTPGSTASTPAPRAATQGRATTPPASLPPVALLLDAHLTRDRIALREARLSSGSGKLDVQAQADPRRDATGATTGWKLDGRFDLRDFDPRPWSPQARKAIGDRPTSLNGRGQMDLLLPTSAPQGEGLGPWLSAFRGQAQARLDNSRLAGAPLVVDLSLRDDAAARRLVAQAMLEAADNRIEARGELDTANAQGRGDHWKVELKAPALSGLEPVVELVAPSMKLEGAVDGTMSLQGRWPAVTTQGDLGLNRLVAGAMRLDTGRARWQLGMSPDDPMQLDASVDGWTIAGQVVETLRLALDGTGRDHRLSLDARARPAPAAVASARVAAQPSAAPGAAPAPPVATDTPDAATVASRRLQASLRAQGGWGGDPLAGDLSWRGRVQRLEVLPSQASTVTGVTGGAPRNGAAPTPAAVASAASAVPLQRAASTASGPAPDNGLLPWLRAEPFDLQVASTPRGQSLSLGATTLSILDASLRLEALQWSAPAGGQPTVDMSAELQPLRVAPLLARLQPTFGWGGNLEIAGRVKLHRAAGQSLEADMLLERRRGDLTVTDPSLAAITVPISASGVAGGTLDLGATQRFGLNDARISLAARNGNWQLTQHIAGRNLGEISGQQTVQAAPDAIWPAAQASLRGEVSIQVENMGVWSGWLPAGWRLGGSLDTRATIGGTVGAPTYVGRLTGNALSARNLLLGVDVRDGELALTMDGERAQLERLVVHGSEGQVRVEGGMRFGAEPTLDLKVIAERFAALSRIDRRVLVSGQGQVAFTPQRLGVDGRFSVDEGLIDISRGDAPSAPADVRVVGRDPLPDDTAPAASDTSGPGGMVTALDLHLDLGRQLRLRGRGIDTLLRGELHLTSPNSRPSMTGVVRTENGIFAAYAQKLNINRGTVTFNGPIDNPQLDILALRASSPTAIDEEVKVGVEIIGTAQNPRIRLYSEPDMSESDKLSWLLLGRGPTGLGRTELALVQQAALALLSGDDNTGGNPVLSQLGIDELSIRQDEGATGTQDTVVSLGKQLSSRWYVGYERSLNATTGTWQLIYRLAQRVTLRAQSGLDNALDVIWTWRWQ